MTSLLAHDIYSVPRTQDVCLLENVHFKDMFFSESLIKSLIDNGFHKPSPIQHKAIPLARCGFDLIVKSKSGTGKTLVFAITALESLDLSLNRVQVIILTPTREIALQSAQVLRVLSNNMKDIFVETFIGGLPLARDVTAAGKCHIAIGAPGRVKQLIELGHLKTEAVRLFVLDEADQLMAKSFQSDINFIFWSLSEFKQTMALSATYPDELVSFLGNYMRSGRLVTPHTDPIPVLMGLKQFVSLTRDHPDSMARLTDKETRLVSLLSQVKFNQCIVFSNYQTRAESTCNMLRCRGWSCEWISGRMSQEQRLKALNEMQQGRCRILVTTNLTARGIDSKGIDLVVNLDTPHDPSIYLHRMGRAGRYGAHGVVITILSRGQDLENFLRMLGRIGKGLPVKVIPSDNVYDLWSDCVNRFHDLYGIQSQEEDDDDDVDVSGNRQPVPGNDRSEVKSFVREKYDLQSSRIEDKAMADLPPDLNEQNFPSFRSNDNIVSLNDYFLLKMGDEDFASLDSLKDSFERFNHTETASDPSRKKSKDESGNDTVCENGRASKREICADKKQTVGLSKQTMKTVGDPTPARRFSYSDIAKGKRVECKPADIVPLESVGIRLKKSPLKFFPGEKVSSSIEGISISDRALDGFSKRMYSCVVVRGKQKTGNAIDQTDDTGNTLESRVKTSHTNNSSNHQAHTIKDTRRLSQPSDIDPLKNVSVSVPTKESPVNTVSVKSKLDRKPELASKGNEVTSDNKEESSKSVDMENESPAAAVSVEDNVSTGKDMFHATSRMQDSSSRMQKNTPALTTSEGKPENSSQRREVCPSSSTSPPLSHSQHSSRSNHKNPSLVESNDTNNSLYENRIADLSTISTNYHNGTMEESSTSDSSDTEGEYVVSGSFGNDSSFVRNHSLGQRSSSRSAIDQSHLSRWLHMYQQQSSIIYNYMVYARRYRSSLQTNRFP